MIKKELIEEINLLLQYDLSSAQVGIKVHSTASEEVIAAAKRLYEKGLTDQVDGGYLTTLGRESADYLQRAMIILKSQPAES